MATGLWLTAKLPGDPRGNGKRSRSVVEGGKGGGGSVALHRGPGCHALPLMGFSLRLHKLSKLGQSVTR